MCAKSIVRVLLVAAVMGFSLAWAQALLHLEQAREVDLDGLVGLGPLTTQRILEEQARQPFQDWKDLMQRVAGIGSRKAEQLSAQGLRVQGQSYRPGVTPASP